MDAALWVVRALNVEGSDDIAFDRSLRTATTQGRFPKTDLDLAVDLLLSANLLVRNDGRVRPAHRLTSLSALPDDAARTLLGKLLDWTQEDSREDERLLMGDRGEKAVVQWCVDELLVLGHSDLIREVVQVSLISDRFGYDVTAPTLGGAARLLEVKATRVRNGKTFRFLLTRNEYEVGRRSPHQWALVACLAAEDNTSVLGWCRAAELERYLPDDGNGHWTEAQVALPTSALLAGVPSAVP
ncbi:MAG: DUF3883 domain-containing protein [Microbacterium sp.]